MSRRILVALSATVACFFAACGNALPQTSPIGSALITKAFTMSAAGNSSTLALTDGQSICAVTVESSSSFTGLTLIPQVASDGPNNPQSWTSAPTVGGGSISTAGTYIGNITSTGLSNFRVNVAAISSGTVTGVIACSSAGGSGNVVTIGNAPVPVFTPIPASIGAQAGQSVISYEQAYNAATSNFDPPRLMPDHVLETSSGGTQAFVLTSSSATACTSLGTGVGHIARMWNSGPATTVYLTLYDEGVSPACATADIRWGDGASIVVPSGASVLTFDYPITSGLAYKLSAALSTSQHVIITTYGLGI